jgi:hypothetical protein
MYVSITNKFGDWCYVNAKAKNLSFLEEFNLGIESILGLEAKYN